MGHMEPSAVSGMDDSCCDEERSAEIGYKVCKPGQENCHAPVLFLISAVKCPSIPPGQALLGTYDPIAPRQSSEGFWRPPRV
jgi:hypothetical protein